ncbi:MFS transporter [Pendulispora brunnea]|uniref:MFS transporter n=1 Tax=Pendulispora brunnea TaxID=2905690 RepID=A0ABZ2JW92_9BACT
MEAAVHAPSTPKAMKETKAMNRWGALGILMALAFLNYMDRHLVFPLQGLIGKEFHIDTGQLGALTTGFTIVYAASAPLIGALSDRFSRKSILLMALLGWSVVTMMSGTATGFASLLVWRALTGLGEGGYFPTAVSLIGDLFGPNLRGKAIALHGVCTTLGGSAGYAMGGFLGERFGWRMPFFLSVLPGIVLAGVLARYFREPARGTTAPAQSESADHATVEQKPRAYWRIVTSPPVLLIALAACAAMYSMNGLNTFLPLYLVEARHISVSRAGALTGAFFACTLFGQLAGGTVSDALAGRLRGARPLLVGLAYFGVVPAAFAIVHIDAVIVALACYGLTQFGRGWAEPNLYGTIIDSVPAHERGTAQGFLLLMTFTGASLSPWVAGIIIKQSGYVPVVHMLAISAGIAASLAFALVVYVRRKHIAN